MPDGLSGADQVRREFTELQERLNESLSVLDELDEIRDQFAGMVNTYNEVNRLLKSSKETFSELQSEVNESLEKLRNHTQEQAKLFQSLEEKNSSEWEKFRTSLLLVQDTLHKANDNLRTEVGHKVSQLRGDTETRLSEYLDRLDSIEQTASLTNETVEALDDKVDALEQQHSAKMAKHRSVIDEIRSIAEEAYRSGTATRQLATFGLVVALGALGGLGYLVYLNGGFLM